MDSETVEDINMESGEQGTEPEVESPSPAPSKSPVKKSPQKKGKETNTEEEQEEGSSKLGLLDSPLVVDGKRHRQKVERLAAPAPKPETPKAESHVGEGRGTALGQLQYANEYISEKPSADLKKLHKLLFLREGSVQHPVLFKKTLRAFNGWWFDKESAEWTKRVTFLNKLSTTEVKHLRSAVGVKKAAASKNEEITQLMEYLDCPQGKGYAPKVAQPKKEKGEKKSKTPKAKSSTSAKGKSKSKKDDTPLSSGEDSDEEKEEEKEEEEVEEKKTPKKKAAATSKRKAPASSEKKTAGKSAPKKAKKDVVESEGEEEEKEDTPKSDKGSDSDTSDEATGTEKEVVEDSKNPSEAAVLAMIKELLKTFDLASVSMKQMCQAVCEKFPDSNLPERKLFLKEKIKEVLAES